MLAALIIVFREVFEAGLVVGIVMAVTRGIAGRGWWIGTGISGGTVGACLVAIFAGALGSAFAGMGQELFNAAILSVAVLMLTWHNIWMSRHGRELAADMRYDGQGYDVTVPLDPAWLSSGDFDRLRAAFHAALELAARPEMAGKRIVTIACDGGERYMSLPFFAE